MKTPSDLLRIPRAGALARRSLSGPSWPIPFRLPTPFSCLKDRVQGSSIKCGAPYVCGTTADGRRQRTSIGSGDSSSFITRDILRRWELRRSLRSCRVWRAVSVSAHPRRIRHSALYCFSTIMVLRIDVGAIEEVPRAKSSHRVPVVLSREEVGKIFKNIQGTMWMVVALLYGAGLRLQECLELRVKDLDFDRHEIVVRRGKGQKDRRTMLPVAVEERLQGHLRDVRRQHERDLAAGVGRVVLPFALDRNIPTLLGNGDGSLCFRRRGSVAIPDGGHRLASICTSRQCNGRWRMRCAAPVSRSVSDRTALDTRLRHTCSRTAMTFGPCKNCSGIRTSARRWRTYTC
jgi:integrase